MMPVPPQLDTLTVVSRWEGAIVYWLMVVISLALTRRLNGLAKAMLLWMLAEALISTAVAIKGPDDDLLTRFRIFRMIAGGILLFEIAQLVLDRFLYPITDRLRQWWWTRREERGR